MSALPKRQARTLRTLTAGGGSSTGHAVRESVDNSDRYGSSQGPT